nr:TIR domain-containing protein [Myxococcus sp. MH1]
MKGEVENHIVTQAQPNDAVPQELRELLRGNGYVLQAMQGEDSVPVSTGTTPHINGVLLVRRATGADVLLVLISPGASTKAQVNQEIERAKKQGLRIVGVYVNGGQESDIPTGFQMYGDALVGCLADHVIDAICGRINIWLKPDCEAPVPERDIEHYTCGEPDPE